MKDSAQELVYTTLQKISKKEIISPEQKIEEFIEDSIQLFELIITLEEHSHKHITSEDIEKIVTIQDAIHFLKNTDDA